MSAIDISWCSQPHTYRSLGLFVCLCIIMTLFVCCHSLLSVTVCLAVNIMPWDFIPFCKSFAIRSFQGNCVFCIIESSITTLGPNKVASIGRYIPTSLVPRLLSLAVWKVLPLFILQAIKAWERGYIPTTQRDFIKEVLLNVYKLLPLSLCRHSRR